MLLMQDTQLFKIWLLASLLVVVSINIGEAQEQITRSTKTNKDRNIIETRMKTGDVSTTSYNFEKTPEQYEDNDRNASLIEYPRKIRLHSTVDRGIFPKNGTYTCINDTVPIYHSGHNCKIEKMYTTTICSTDPSSSCRHSCSTGLCYQGYCEGRKNTIFTVFMKCELQGPQTCKSAEYISHDPYKILITQEFSIDTAQPLEITTQSYELGMTTPPNGIDVNLETFTPDSDAIGATVAVNPEYPNDENEIPEPNIPGNFGAGFGYGIAVALAVMILVVVVVALFIFVFQKLRDSENVSGEHTLPFENDTLFQKIPTQDDSKQRNLASHANKLRRRLSSISIGDLQKVSLQNHSQPTESEHNLIEIIEKHDE